MTLFVIQGIDKPDSAATRAQHRTAHREHLAAAGDVVKLAGPLENERGEVIGSLILIETADLAEARAFADADPFSKAGLFERFELRPWRISVGALR